MSTNKPNIAQLRKYLNGELDARAMYEVERQLHEDPFLWDVLKGMESGDEDHQPNLDAIDRLINERVEQGKKRTIPMWRVIPIAASLLIALGIGGWWLTHQTAKLPMASVITKAEVPVKVKAETAPVIIQPVQPAAKQPMLAKLNVKKHSTPALPEASISTPNSALASIAAKEDTTEYKASDYRVTPNPNFDKTLQGRVAGVNVSAKGRPGAATEIKIRGAASLKDSQKPLYIVDGVPVENFDINKLKPADIKSIDLLKDSAATSIYGSRASNGVIVLNTNNNFAKEKSLKEVTVIGYGTQKKATLTGSIATISESHAKQTTEDLLKKMPGIKVDSAGNITAEGKPITKVRINGKDFAGGDIKTATKNLPADIVEKVQAIDDYGDLAARTGIKSGEPDKVLNITIKKTRLITGRVTDKTDHSALPGVSVKIAGTNTSTQTNTDGVFTITVPNDAVLNIAYIGYETQQVKVKDKEKLSVALSASSQSLSEVVVIGYGTKKEDQVYEGAHPAKGWSAYNKYLKENTLINTVKPGKVKLAFTVDPSGSIGNIRIVKGLTDELNQKAIDLIKNGDDWIGANDNKPDNVKLTVKFHNK